MPDANPNPYEAPYKTPLEAMAWIDRETKGGKDFHGHAFSVVPVKGGFAVVPAPGSEPRTD